MNRKILIALACCFGALMVIGGTFALTPQTIPIPLHVELFPQVNYELLALTFNYDVASNRHTSCLATIKNVSFITRNCTVLVNFYDAGKTKIAWGSNQILNLLPSANATTQVNFSWASGKNLTDVVSGDVTAY